MTEFWEARRKKLEVAVRAAALELLDHMGDPAAFRLELVPNNPDLILIAGPLSGVRTLAQFGPADPVAGAVKMDY